MGSVELWDQWIPYFSDSLTDYYKIHNVIVKEFDSKPFLSTCSDTFVETDDDPDEVNENIPMNESG